MIRHLSHRFDLHLLNALKGENVPSNWVLRGESLWNRDILDVVEQAIERLWEALRDGDYEGKSTLL